MKISFHSCIPDFSQTDPESVLVIPFQNDIPDTGLSELNALCAQAVTQKRDTLKTDSTVPVFHEQSGSVVLLMMQECTEAIDWKRLGHKVFVAAGDVRQIRVVLPGVAPDSLADFCLGVRLSSYSFRNYWNKKAEDAAKQLVELKVFCDDPESCSSAEAQRAHLAFGVAFSRDLISEPPNVLDPETFAARLQELESLGVQINVLDENAMTELGMNALLGVAQGSVKPPRLVSMHWNNRPDSKPTAIIGKGVTFDTGGISLKPAKNMEEMKFDMGGAGVVSGLMKALALQKAEMNVVGVVGLVENMPDGNAQRPGDVVTAMDGQTIAVHNTDAEGRLVLADVLHYTNITFAPSAMINLATLTGAIIVALGSEHAGMFSNDDAIAESLHAAGIACDEKVWRMPLHKNYDKQLDTLVADVCNIGGPEAGAITAAQFLQRFVGDTPWAHLDIAGVIWNTKTRPNAPAGASGFGVQLLHHWLEQRFQG